MARSGYDSRASDVKGTHLVNSFSVLLVDGNINNLCYVPFFWTLHLLSLMKGNGLRDESINIIKPDVYPMPCEVQTTNPQTFKWLDGKYTTGQRSRRH